MHQSQTRDAIIIIYEAISNDKSLWKGRQTTVKTNCTQKYHSHFHLAVPFGSYTSRYTRDRESRDTGEWAADRDLHCVAVRIGTTYKPNVSHFQASSNAPVQKLFFISVVVQY